MNIREHLKRNRLIMDGAMGTYYADRYARRGEPSEIGNFDAPLAVRAIHMEYIKAGAGLIRTNTFASNYESLKRCGYGGESHNPRTVVARNLTLGYNIAREAVNASGHLVFIAADIGPIPENASTEEKALLDEYIFMAQTFIGLGAGIIMFETFSDFKYIIPVAQYIKDHSDIFVMTSFALNKFGFTKSGLSAAKILEIAASESAIDSVGFNCGIGAAHMFQVLKHLDLDNLIVTAAPNAGYPDMLRDRSVYRENMDYFGDRMGEIANLGVNITGGCCGTTPGYIRKLASMVDVAQIPERKIPEINECNGSMPGFDGYPVKNLMAQKMAAGQKVIVVELDPPHNASVDKLMEAAALLKQYPVDGITLSDSPMGKMRADSMMTGARVQNLLNIPVMPHIACRDRNQIAMGGSILGAYLSGIRSLLVVTGDPVQAGDRQVVSSVFDFNSITFMEYLKQMNETYFSADPLIYGGALNYGRKNPDYEIERMRRKIEAGASYFLTQPVYSRADIDRLAYIKSQVNTKIFGGIMPLVSYRNAMFMKNEVYGIQVPDEIIECYRPEMTREEGEAAGIQIACELMTQMEDVVDGFYFMVPFNRAAMICRIIETYQQVQARREGEENA